MTGEDWSTILALAILLASLAWLFLVEARR